MNTSNMVDYLKDVVASKKLVKRINDYWKAKGRPDFFAWTEEIDHFVPRNDGSKKREPLIVIRSNIKLRLQ